MRKINLKYKALAFKQIQPYFNGFWSTLSHNMLPFTLASQEELLPSEAPVSSEAIMAYSFTLSSLSYQPAVTWVEKKYIFKI